MTAFWSMWVMVLVVVTIGISVFLFIWGQRVRIPQEPDGTTGHVWAHGTLREAVRTLPLWWVLASSAVFVGAIAYLYLYPGFGGNAGALGWTSLGKLAKDTAANQARLDPVLRRLVQEPVEQLAADPAIQNMGQRLYIDNCSACHGHEGRGNLQLGAPNLTDAESLYGNDASAILTSILDGRNGVMPAFTPTFDAAATESLARYVLSLSATGQAPTSAKRSHPQFTVCVSCHGAESKGNPTLGAPDLTDTVWMYGGDLDSVVVSISQGRAGVMPAWRSRLSEAEARAIAAWVYARSHEPVGAR